MAFRSASWWSIVGAVRRRTGSGFGARLVDVGGGRIATGDDFGPTGQLTSPG